MAQISESLIGRYLGHNRVRPGREDELRPQERKLLQSAPIELVLTADGTFRKQVTEGKFTLEGKTLVFLPIKFGGKTLEEMRHAAELMGRTFNLEFVFDAFHLLVENGNLVTPGDGSLIYIEYQKA